MFGKRELKKEKRDTKVRWTRHKKLVTRQEGWATTSSQISSLVDWSVKDSETKRKKQIGHTQQHSTRRSWEMAIVVVVICVSHPHVRDWSIRKMSVILYIR
jgi:hypothetical protein